ncbi:hypothetical protein BGZ89_001777 [Linnemannia elongata]|nr:hypothetical protein BGZ89_001777 [Linnemannia elongata]
MVRRQERKIRSSSRAGSLEGKLFEVCKEREQGFKKDLRGLSSEVNVEALEMLEISDRVKQGRVWASSKISNESVVKLRVIVESHREDESQTCDWDLDLGVGDDDGMG